MTPAAISMMAAESASSTENTLAMKARSVVQVAA